MTATEKSARGPAAMGGEYEISAELEEALAHAATTMQAPRGDDVRAATVLRLCRALRLNPLTSPVQWIRLSGRDTLYVTRTATDQLAAMHGLNRRTVRGPEIADIAGTKVALCVVEATLPNGRSETATATLPVADPVNLYMKLETKAKRRATLAILGLGILAEDELETIPASAKEPAVPAAPDPRTVPTEPAPPVEEPAARPPLEVWREKFARANGRLSALAPGIATLTGESATEIQRAYLTALAARVTELPTVHHLERFEHWVGGAPEALTGHPAWVDVLAAIEARRAELTAREPGEEG